MATVSPPVDPVKPEADDQNADLIKRILSSFALDMVLEIQEEDDDEED